MSATFGWLRWGAGCVAWDALGAAKASEDRQVTANIPVRRKVIPVRLVFMVIKEKAEETDTGVPAYRTALLRRRAVWKNKC